MCECSPPRAFLSAGASTTANRIGVSSGTAIWRGLWAVSAARRRASVSRAPTAGVRRGVRTPAGTGWERGVGAVTAFVAMGVLSVRSGDGADAGTGESQVDVVEGRRARADA